METKKFWHFILAIGFLAAILVPGCGDSGDLNQPSGNTGPNVPTGTVLVEFDRTNVLGQSTQEGFANADTYAVSILDPNNNLVVPTVFVAADQAQAIQTIRVTGVPAGGGYQVIITAYIGDQIVGQVAGTGVVVGIGGVTRVSNAGGISIEVYEGSFQPDQGGGTDGGGTTGDNGSGGTTGDGSGGTTGDNGSGGTTGDSGGSGGTGDTGGGYTTGGY